MGERDESGLGVYSLFVSLAWLEEVFEEEEKKKKEEE